MQLLDNCVEHVLGVLMIMGLLLMRAYNDQFNQIHGIMRGGGSPGLPGLAEIGHGKIEFAFCLIRIRLGF